MSRIRVGVHLQPQHTTIEAYGKAWTDADDLGVDTIWNWDHFFPLYSAPDGPHFEAWTTLTAFGARTRRAQVGCLVLSMSYRNPALLSAMAKTLDHAIGGRLILGLGAGWFERDYAEYGYEFGTPGERLKNLARGLEIIKDRWQKDEPKPVNGTIPILIGGSGEQVTLRITARHADMWNGSGPPDRLAHKNAVLDEWCRKIGRDPAAIERTVSVNAPDLDNLDAFVEAGGTHLIYRLPPPYNMTPIERLIAWRDRRNSAGG